MSASTSSKRKIKRKAAKKYTRVTFELPFMDGTFDLPSFAQVPTGVQRRSMQGDIDALAGFLEKNCDPDVVEAFDDLDQEEAGDFMDAWAKASGLDLGK